MQPVELLIFDLDGTLIDSKLDIAHCVNWTLADLEIPTIPHQEIYRHVGYGVRALISGAVGEEHLDLYQEAITIFDRHYTEHLLDHTCLFPGMERVLEKFQDKKMAVITNKPQKYTDPIIEGLNLQSYFGAVFGRDAFKESKPHPEPIFRVWEKLPAARNKTVIIGDTDIDIQTGKNAEIITCGVSYGFGSLDKLQEAEPDFIVNEPEELIQLDCW